jgi:hypothetical protein
MSGTFQPGDCLLLSAILLSDVQTGDVIVFRKINHQAGKGELAEAEADNSLGEVHIMGIDQPVMELVHRVKAITKDGLITWGDNNLYPDSDLVTADNLVGKVTALERHAKRIPVAGSLIGILRARFLRTWKFHLWLLIVKIGRKPYRWLKARKWIPKLWHPTFVKLQLSYENGPVVKYIHGGKTIASWWPQKKRFVCRKPYDLVLHLNDLPEDIYH